MTLGSVLVFAGRMEEGWRLLEDAVARARRRAGGGGGARLPDDRVVRVGAGGVRPGRALAPEGIGYAEQVELWNHRHYMASHLAHVAWATGDWQAAARTAQQALADGRGGITTRMTAKFVLGYVALGRGDWTAAAGLLGEAFGHGDRTAAAQRLSPPLWGVAEAGQARGRSTTPRSGIASVPTRSSSLRYRRQLPLP